MRLFIPLLAVAFGAGRLESQKCPDVDPASGYPIAATFEGATSVDSAWLGAVARVSAYRWKVPSRRRNTYVGWERVSRRLLPPEPRWADDWSPEGKHRATMRVVLFRDARTPRGEIVEVSGDKRFDETLSSILDDPMPASPALPGLPPGSAGDSIVVLLAFGVIPTDGVQGVVRFAAAQTPIEIRQNSLQVMAVPTSSSGRPVLPPPVTVKYDVTEKGVVDDTSIEFVSGAGSGMETMIRDGLRRTRFKAPTSNCRPIAQTVVQVFGR